MSDDHPHEFFVGLDVPFAEGSGFVGMATVPGAAPQAVAALSFEAETDVFEDEITETVWLKARLDPEKPGEEFLMCAARAEELKRIVTAIAEASRGFFPNGARTLPGRYQGYHNSAQFAFDRSVTEECRENLTADIRQGRQGRGFELALRDAAQRASYEKFAAAFSTGGQDLAVARIAGELDGPALSLFVREFARLKEWQAGMREKVDAHLEAAPSAAPAM